MKKFLKLTTVVVSMVMALTFVSCANGNENGQLNFVGTYGVSKVEIYQKNSKVESSITATMPTSTSIRKYGTKKVTNGETTTVMEMDYTVTKIANRYSFNWAKYTVDGQAASEDAKTQQEKLFDDNTWNDSTAPFAITYTTTADGTWSNNSEPESSGTYTVDEANSKVTIITIIDGGVLREHPLIEEGTYSDKGKTFVIVKDFSSGEMTNKMTMTFTRK